MSFKSIITSSMRKASAIRMTYIHKRSYAKIMAMNGIPDRRQEGEDEWVEKWSVLGKANPLYYRCFSHYIGRDMGIIPADLCCNVIEKCLNPMKYAPYYSDKNIFDRIFPVGTCPITVLRKMGGTFYTSDYSFLKIEDNDGLYKSLESSPTDVICLKPSVETGSGVGVRFYKRSGDGWTDMKTGEKLTLELLNKCYKDDFIIQEGLVQSEEMSYFNPTSINTLRLTLYRSVVTDEWAVTSSMIRIGRKGALIDNAHAGGAYAGIWEDGRICDRVLDQYGQAVTVFNDIDFKKDHRIKDWDRIVQFAKEVGSKVQHMRLLALDIMIDAEGNPKLVEFNCTGYGMWPFQFTTHGAFGEYTDEIIEYCRTRKDSFKLYVKI